MFLLTVLLGLRRQRKKRCKMNLVQSKRTWGVWLVGVVALAQLASGAEEPNGVFPNDPLFPLQWHLHNTGQNGGTPGVDINAVKAWEITTGDPNIIVAVIGEGIDLDHPDLVNNLASGTDFFENDDLPYPSRVAGSEVETMNAGLISAEGDNGIGVTGVTWHCKIMPVRILNMINQNEADVVPQAKEAAAYRWAAGQGADIMIHAWVMSRSFPAAVHASITEVTRPGGIGRNGKGCLFVAPAHFGIEPGCFYPGLYPETISVDGVDPWDNLWWPHEIGSRVDLVAPYGCPPRFCGNSAIPMWTTDIAGPAGADALDYTDQGGLVACSLVAGVAALILSIEPNLTSEEVRHYLCRSAHDLGEPGRDDEYGWGRVDARAALDMVLTCRADLNKDGIVDEQDLAVLEQFMGTTEPLADIAPAAKPDGIVDELDRQLMMQYWHKEYPEFGLVARWKLDETEGLIAADSAGGYDATLSGGPLWSGTSAGEGGQVGGALALDGVDDCLIAPFILNPADGPFSVFAWVKGGESGQVIVSQTGAANWLMSDVEGKLMTEFQGSGRFGGPLHSQTIISDGQWHRIGLVWDGSHRTLYVDNVIAAQDTQTAPSGSPNGLFIGCGKAMEPGTFFWGLIDDVRIYNRAIKP
ncbi:MAG: hypothetical protein A2Z25_00025 [Planctomycetes bacterium RBG_16_55_9]|nr:MAG: hypothetical protein A2Z25_00025 [Planctomycetes bacterium RBG_16_55_9]